MAEFVAKTESKTVELPNTHWLHLADGTTVESKGVSGSVNGIPVIAHYEKPPELIAPAVEPHRF